MSFKTKTVGTENLPDSSVGQMSAAQACASKFDFHSRHMLLQCGALASQSRFQSEASNTYLLPPHRSAHTLHGLHLHTQAHRHIQLRNM